MNNRVRFIAWVVAAIAVVGTASAATTKGFSAGRNGSGCNPFPGDITAPFCGIWGSAPLDSTATVMVPINVQHSSTGSGTLAVDAFAWARTDPNHVSTVIARILTWSQDGLLTCAQADNTWNESGVGPTSQALVSCPGFVPASQGAWVRFSFPWWGTQTDAQRPRIYGAAYTFGF